MKLFAKKENAEKKPKSKARKIISWSLTGVFGALFLFVLAFQITGLATKSKNYGVPSFFGLQLNMVITDSMEPDYKVGSMIFVKKIEPSTIKIGDDITFYYEPWKSLPELNGVNPIITHRVVEIYQPTAETGNLYYFDTKGINPKSQIEAGQTQHFSEKVVLGKVIGNSQALGGLYKFASSIWGLLVLLLVPTLYITVTSVIDLVKASKETDEEIVTETVVPTNSDTLSSLSDEDRERLKKELIEEMMEKKNNEKK